MTHKIIRTEDGSNSIFVESLGQSYHSAFGAIAESRHIFIKDGLEFIHPDSEINILEIGFGTGLNALLSLAYAREHKVKINYFAIEKYPLEQSEYSKLNYPQIIDRVVVKDFLNLHLASWGEYIDIDNNFSLHKSQQDIKSMSLKENNFDLVYFDAFSPDRQPLNWTEEVFAKIYKSMKSQAVMTTYSVKGDVKRALKTVGFAIEKIPGPKGKREILRVQKRLFGKNTLQKQ